MREKNRKWIEPIHRDFWSKGFLSWIQWVCERCGQVFLHLCFTWFLFINLDMGLLTQQISMLSTYCMSSSLLGLELWFSMYSQRLPWEVPQTLPGNPWGQNYFHNNTKTFFPLSVSFSHKCTVEFSRKSLKHGITSLFRHLVCMLMYSCVFKMLQF